MYKQIDSYARLLTLYPEGSRLSSFERLMAARGPLLSWYRENRRKLPWRETADAYAIWISEIMLQQTRVEAVKPYYARFMELFPTVWELKEAPDDLLLKCWLLQQGEKFKEGGGCDRKPVRRPAPSFL